MKIRKAVIAAAAPDQPRLPFQSLVDRKGENKTALELIVAEAAEAGIEEICVIIRPGDLESFSQATSSHDNITFVEQTSPKGYSDALLRAEEFVEGESFLHLVGDHIYLSRTDECCAKQLIDIATRESCAVTAVQSTHESKLPYFGTVGASRLAQESRLFQVNRVAEKPTPTEAEQELAVGGLRAGFFLCVSGMHVLPASFLTILRSEFEEGTRHISGALNKLAECERYLAYQLEGTRINIGAKYGLLRAQLEIALSGPDRDAILTELVAMLANRVSSNES